MGNLIQILIGSISLSIVHALMPNHWLPVVLIGKSEKWSRREIIKVTALVGFSHTLSTIILGVVIGIIGYKISSVHEHITKLIASAVLFLLGLTYLYLDYRENKTHHHHQHVDIEKINRKSKKAIVTSLAISMFFSPCVEITVYFFLASSIGLTGIYLVSLLYLVITVTGMIIVVDITGRGLKKLQHPFLEHHEKMITGIVLIILSIIQILIPD